MKKTKKKSGKKNKEPLFYVAKKKPGVTFSNGEKVEVALVCPSCQTYWADVTVVYGGHVAQEAFRLKAPYQDSSVKAGKPLTCPACFYKYTNWAVMATIIASANKRKIESEIGGGFQRFGM